MSEVEQDRCCANCDKSKISFVNTDKICFELLCFDEPKAPKVVIPHRVCANFKQMEPRLCCGNCAKSSLVSFDHVHNDSVTTCYEDPENPKQVEVYDLCYEFEANTDADTKS